MNNDLSKLSDQELNQKSEKINEASRAVLRSATGFHNEYTKMLNKRRVNPDVFIETQSEMDELSLAHDLLEEYSKTITDERNRRIEEEKNKITKETPQEETILEKLERYFANYYSFDQIEEGYTIARTCAPHKKLQAVKEFKELTKTGLKEAKQFMDIAFDYLSEK